MTGDELAALRTLIREELTSSEQRTRIFVREEVNTAVYASEVRLQDEIKAVDHLVNQRMDGFERRLDGIEERLHRVEDLQMRMGVNLAKMGTVLEEATIKINELQMSYIALDQKVEGIKHDIQKLVYRVDTADEAISGLALQLKMHRDTRINEAHPPSAA
jgi:chromosome segregation ATPase